MIKIPMYTFLFSYEKICHCTSFIIIAKQIKYVIMILKGFVNIRVIQFIKHMQYLIFTETA